MTHDVIFYTLAEITHQVGENVDATGFVEANINSVGLMVENYINCVCRENFSDTFAATLNIDVKHIITMAAVTLAAVIHISYNMAGYSSRIEAENMINVNLWIHKQAMGRLTDQKTVTFIKGVA